MAAGNTKLAASRNGGKPLRVFREFQFIVVPVLLVEEDGGIPYPQQGEQIVCRGVAELQAVVDRFPADLEALNAAGSPE
jgi:hypothetical protein